MVGESQVDREPAGGSGLSHAMASRHVLRGKLTIRAEVESWVGEMRLGDK